MIKFIMLMMSMLVSAESFAQGGGSGAGNGGKAIVCNNRTQAYVLDYWEARKEASDFKISLGGNALTVDEKVELIISRIRRFDSNFATELESRFEQFKNLQEIQSRAGINQIDDSKELMTPKGDCFKIQVAVNKKAVDLVFNKKFIIDRDVWKLMSKDEQAGLIFHEVLYWSELDRGAEDSLGTRRLNAIFSSEKAASLSVPQYVTLMQTYSKRDEFSNGRVEVSLKKEEAPLFSADGNLMVGMLESDLHFEVNGFKGKCLPRSKVEFDVDQNVASCMVNRVEWTGSFGGFSQRVVFSGNPTLISLRNFQGIHASNLKIELVELSSSEINQKISYTPSAITTSDFYENGMAKKVSVDLSNADLANPSFRVENMKITELSFSEAGKIGSIQISGKGNIYDLIKNERYELTWKPSGVYQVVFDPLDHSIVSVK